MYFSSTTIVGTFWKKLLFCITNKMQITIKLPKVGWVVSKLHIKQKNTIFYFSFCLYQTWKKWPKKFSLDKSEMIPQWMHAIKFLTLVIWSNSSPPSQDSSAMSSRYNKRNQHQMIIQIRKNQKGNTKNKEYIKNTSKKVGKPKQYSKNKILLQNYNKNTYTVKKYLEM